MNENVKVTPSGELIADDPPPKVLTPAEIVNIATGSTFPVDWTPSNQIIGSEACPVCNLKGDELARGQYFVHPVCSRRWWSVVFTMRTAAIAQYYAENPLAKQVPMPGNRRPAL